MGAVKRGQLIAFRDIWNGCAIERVTGLPGDHIEVRSGRLIRNGIAVPEPYREQPYRGGLGDFPLPTDAYPDGSIRWEHRTAYATL
jgi:signal peptidase I